jgi:hypothetical protein
MPVISVHLDGDKAWPDLAAKPSEILHLRDQRWSLAALKGGMSSGKPSLALRLDLPRHSADGATVIVAETSMAAWIAATVALRARFPEAFAGTPLE